MSSGFSISSLRDGIGSDAASSAFGKNDLEKKQDTIDEIQDNMLTMDNVVELGTAFKSAVFKDIPSAAVNVVKSVRTGLTPGFVKRMNRRKVHVKMVEEEEIIFEELQHSVGRTIEKELQLKKVSRAHERKSKQLLEATKHLREEAKKTVKAAKQQSVEKEFEAYHRRRELQYQEMEDKRLKIEEERRLKEEREVQERREFNIQFFGHQAKQLGKEAKETALEKTRRQQAALDRTLHEWEQRQEFRAQTQVEFPPQEPSVGLPGRELGLFGTNHISESSETLFATNARSAVRGGEEELVLEDLDQQDVFVFSAEPHTDYERRNVTQTEIQSHLEQEQALYTAVQQEVQALKLSSERLLDLRDVLEREQQQMSQEILLVERDQRGPPRRMPLASEIPAMNTWKARAAKVFRKLQDVEHAIEKTASRRTKAEKQSLELAQLIAQLQEQCKTNKEGLNMVNGALGQLPMVVGRNISKVSGMGGALAKPKETYQAVTHKSRLAVVRHQSEIAMKKQRESDDVDQQIWLGKLEENGRREDLERVISRIKNISDRLKRVNVDTTRLNLVDSLKGFLASGAKLHPVSTKVMGVLPWFKHHDYRLSCSVSNYRASCPMGGISFELTDPATQDEANDGGVTLGHDTVGYCVGVVELPKHGLWSIVATVCRQGRGEAFDHPDETDFVTVRLGPSVTSLSHVGTFFNKVNPETGTVLYDVKHVFRGSAFAYRFDFSSSSEDPAKHLAVATGMFEEYELQALEEVSDPKLSGRTRVLSSFVKMLRVEETSGKLRETRLLEELIEVEDNAQRQKFWDSQILTQTPQRYSTEYFLRILRAEILLQQEISKNQQKQVIDAQSSGLTSGPGDSGREALLEQSKKKYLLMKRAAQQRKLDEGHDLVHTRVLLWDDRQMTWRNVTVLQCIVRWLDNGLRAHVTHMVQEYDEANELLGDPKEVNLEAFKHFLSPIQVVTPEMAARWREKKAWEDRVRHIEDSAQRKVQETEAAFDVFQRREERLLKRSRRRILGAFESSIEDVAWQNVESDVAQRPLKVLVQRVRLEEKKGIIQLDSTKNPKDQFLQVAKERFVVQFIADQREALERSLSEEEGLVRARLQREEYLMRATTADILARAQQETQEFKDLIRRQKARRKAQLLEEIKLPHEVFRKALPVAHNCEHLRTKAWGNNYGTGVRCLDCKKELSELDQEESQLLGYGSGYDPALAEALKRHREDEHSFRFQSADQLRLIERERLRLEKERREMQEAEGFFYDYQDLQVIYDFDRRHARDIKQHGIFRQGLQWTEDELLTFQQSQVFREKERLQEEGKPLVLLETFDPLGHLEDPPPTFRAVDERHRAQYSQLLFCIGRLHNFRKRIEQNKDERFQLILQRDLYAPVLEFLHKESYQFESTLQGLERDLDRTSKLLATYQSMEQLWQQATLIKQQAFRDWKRAEMNFVGVWDDVKECGERTSFLKDETRMLLRLKLQTEARRGLQQQSVEVAKKTLADSQQRLKTQTRLADVLSYCKPGNLVYTRFGQCYVISYRPADDMLLVNLSFGSPPAKAFLHYSEVVKTEHSLQHAEQLLMGQEDQRMTRLFTLERIQLKKERYAMQQEEAGIRRYYEFLDLGRDEDQQLREAIDEAVQDRHYVAESKRFAKLQKKPVEQVVQALVKERKVRRKDYIGPKSGRPAAMSVWDIYQHRKTVTLEMKQKFILEAASKAETRTRQLQHERRSSWIQTYSFELLLDTVISQMIAEVAEDAHREGRAAKGFAEKKSGVYFPQPPWMQFSTYEKLAKIRRQRKEQLQRELELNAGEAARARNNDPDYQAQLERERMVDPEELQRRKLERRMKRREKKRQLQLCAEMHREEVLSRNFYRWELLENLRERRYMRTEDGLARDIREAEKKALKEAEEQLALLSSFSDGGPAHMTAAMRAEVEAKKQFTYERRRQELKELTLERRRRADDQALMLLEDQFSELLRERDRMERQKKAFTAEYGEDEADEEEKELQEENLEFIQQMIVLKKPAKVPSWLAPRLPRRFKKWDVVKQNLFVKLHVSVRKKQQRIDRHLERDHHRLRRLEMKSYEEWHRRNRLVVQAQLEAELAVLDAEETVAAEVAKLQEVEDNIQRILLYSREKGEEELKSRTELRRREELARRRETEVQEASAWHDVCVRRAKTRDKLKRRVTTDCRWVDADSVNGFHQRFATEKLREHIYLTYFRLIVQSLVNRAEVVATEKRLLGLQGQLSVNKARLNERKAAMKSLLTDLRRDEHMRMRRSLLNQRFFPLMRRKTLEARFRGWVRFYFWNKGHKQAYELKFEVIKRQLDIDRQFKEQLLPEQAKHEATEKAEYQFRRTIMQRHRERTVQCANCHRLYLEGQNHSTACHYHPNRFVMDCPHSCPNPGLTGLCAAHRKRRWTCCDNINAGAAGCARRNHVPPASDPVYEKVMQQLDVRDAELLGTLDERVAEARRQNWPSKASVARREQVVRQEDAIARDRATVARYNDLKFV